MLQSIQAPCGQCQYRHLLRSFPGGTLRSSISVRSMTQLQKRQPSRMILSDKVAWKPESGGNTHRGSGAFGGINRTAAPENLKDRRLRRSNVPRSALRSGSQTRTQEQPSAFATIHKENRRSPGPGAFGAMNRTTVPESVKAQLARPPVNKGPPRRTISPKSERREHDDPRRREGDYHALKMQQSLGTISYHSRMRVKQEISEVESFDQFPLLSLVRNAIGKRALGGLEEITPTPIQKVAIPKLLGQKRRRSEHSGYDSVDSFLLAAETGSGKTLAYLLPILDHIKRSEEVERVEEIAETEKIEKRLKEDPTYVEPPMIDNRIHTTSGRPRAIILLPTAELVTQVAALVRQLAFDVKVRSDGISANFPPHVIKRKIFSEQGIDILIATPHLLESVAYSDPNILSRVRHLVIDEADSLLDRSFSTVVDPIIEKCTPSLEKLIFCSATIPQNIDKYLGRKFPNMTRLVTPNLHAIPRRVQLSVVDIERDPYRGNRDIACADVIHGIGRSAHEPSANEPAEFAVKRILVFVNEREKSVELAEYLKSKGIDAVAMNRDTEAERRSDLLKAFTIRPPQQRASQDPVPTLPEQFKSFEKPEPSPIRLKQSMMTNTKVLVTTDIASRGIDTLAVRTVILYDVPHSTIDFIHRLGRTGRMKMRGRGIVLVGRHDRRDIVKEVKEGMFRGQALI